jgi:citrate synthase
MEDHIALRLRETNHLFPLVEGTEHELAIDFRQLRDKTGLVCLDEGYANTASCLSGITFVDGESGILIHRGYSIEELAERSHFLETAYLIIYGELPSDPELKSFSSKVIANMTLPASLEAALRNFPRGLHPMAMAAALVQVLSGYYPNIANNNRSDDAAAFDELAPALMGQMAALTAWIFNQKKDVPCNYPHTEGPYADTFLDLFFSKKNQPYAVHPDLARALDLIFLLHADHEQNCSTSTVRMVTSGGTNPYAAVSAGISALWGPLHGGANMAVIHMLKQIHESGDDGQKFIENAKKGSGRLVGFGHRVYKNYDPRAKIMAKTCEKVLKAIGVDDPLLKIAKHLESCALQDEYFISRKLYPNVDFYSGIILRASGIPLDFFTNIFAIGRTPGWLANWREMALNPKTRIYRPRQIYIGPERRSYPKSGP